MNSWPTPVLLNTRTYSFDVLLLLKVLILFSVHTGWKFALSFDCAWFSSQSFELLSRKDMLVQFVLVLAIGIAIFLSARFVPSGNYVFSVSGLFTKLIHLPTFLPSFYNNCQLNSFFYLHDYVRVFPFKLVAVVVWWVALGGACWLEYNEWLMSLYLACIHG